MIGLVEEGDRIEIDIPNRTIRLAVDEAELERRKAEKDRTGWKPAEKRSRKVSKALQVLCRVRHERRARRGAGRRIAVHRCPAFTGGRARHERLTRQFRRRLRREAVQRSPPCRASPPRDGEIGRAFRCRENNRLTLRCETTDMSGAFIFRPPRERALQKPNGLSCEEVLSADKRGGSRRPRLGKHFPNSKFPFHAGFLTPEGRHAAWCGWPFSGAPERH